MNTYHLKYKDQYNWAVIFGVKTWVNGSRAIKTTLACISVLTDGSLTCMQNNFIPRARTHKRHSSHVTKSLIILPDLFMACSYTDIKSCCFAARASVSTHTSSSNNKPARLHATARADRCKKLDSLQTRDSLTSYMAEVNATDLHVLHRTPGSFRFDSLAT